MRVRPTKKAGFMSVSKSKRQMVINYVPGEECRVAVVADGKLEEFHAERLDGPSSHVGNIYVGKVANVEPGIQAAFIDFGLEANGFLHTSDVHPQYFPGEDSDTTERVGKKTRRSERPPIQDCLRRGDETAVQVLKEGVGTKGPTVTSYLSIPGRFLVMMPQMDKVGVSRKVEDEELRKKMRDILDQLDLPEGFGFILRTAGFDRTKAELKRDLAYLMRLWKDMEKRWHEGAGKPRLLYSESDLLVRALRDILSSEIEEIVVDNQAALTRAARFLKIVSPRTTTLLTHYTGKAPIFHATGIEPQIKMIHAREVPLPSGGRLVIDEAEALVAIDVNSGKMRDARDADATAYKTNMEAADEICRQLRLRDIGGVIVNDFIDMRQLKHRRELENRMRENLKRDRARWTIAEVSEFGILEMTRQRMRASHESQHFIECPTCKGRGLVQKPDSVAAESLRELSAMLDSPKVGRIELVVHPRIAGELLSTRRRALSRIERISGKHVDVRVSDAIAVDRVTFYAYDQRGADIDLATLELDKPSPEQFKVYEIKADAADDWASQVEAIEQMAVEQEHEVDDDAIGEESLQLHPIEFEPTELSEYYERPGQRAQRGPGSQAGQPRGYGQEQRSGNRGEPRQGRGPGQGPIQGQGQNQGQFGPDGGVEFGEDGQRRRRRRRRGGRGRGPAGDGQMNPGPGYGQGYGSEHGPGYGSDQGQYSDQHAGASDQPRFDQPPYAQPGYVQPGNVQGGYEQSAYDQQAAYSEVDGQYADQQGFGYAQPRYGQPGSGQPGYEQTGYDQQGMSQAGLDQVGFDEAGYDQSAYGQDGYQQPGYGSMEGSMGGPGNAPGQPMGTDGEGGEGNEGQGRRRRRRRRGGRGRGGPDGQGGQGGQGGHSGQYNGYGEFGQTSQPAGDGHGPGHYAEGGHPEGGYAEGGYDEPFMGQGVGQPTGYGQDQRGAYGSEYAAGEFPSEVMGEPAGEIVIGDTSSVLGGVSDQSFAGAPMAGGDGDAGDGEHGPRDGGDRGPDRSGPPSGPSFNAPTGQLPGPSAGASSGPAGGPGSEPVSQPGAADASPKPRLLYGGIRRKLNSADLKNVAKKPRE
jgi:ribonuclease E